MLLLLASFLYISIARFRLKVRDSSYIVPLKFILKIKTSTIKKPLSINKVIL